MCQKLYHSYFINQLSYINEEGPSVFPHLNTSPLGPIIAEIQFVAVTIIATRFGRDPTYVLGSFTGPNSVDIVTKLGSNILHQ